MSISTLRREQKNTHFVVIVSYRTYFAKYNYFFLTNYWANICQIIAELVTS